MLSYLFRSKREMQGLINVGRKNLAEAETKISERNKLIKSLSNENKKLKAKITDLENNIDFLVNNLSPKKRASLEQDKFNTQKNKDKEE